ncbi:metallophosphoesterase [Maribellus maritimus]|uniref:metallophosphoesterase n=1 Tax=Maribellus maritimus TaxID=2870838 RepID=UPI001EEBCCB4|nr:metallophosphoesterase [Maribellus maritimus]MCG6187776.1 metallophosphoesterase [Maribellus maritimus]
MRSFQLLYILLFAGFYILVCLGAYFNLGNLLRNKSFKIGYWVYVIMFIFFFVFLYIYPNQPGEADNYFTYFYFNAFLFIDLTLKIVLSLFYVLSKLFRSGKVVPFAGLIISIGLGLTMLWGLSAGKNKIKTKNEELYFATLPEGFENFKVVHISDIHLGSIRKSSRLLTEVEKEIRDVNPDLILFTGDLVNNFSYETEGWNGIFNKLNSGGTSFSILGNHDYGDYMNWKTESLKKDNFEEIVLSNSNLGFQLLRNENKVIYRGTDSIFVVGVENWGHPPFPQYANLERAGKGIPNDAFKILMTHDPAHWETVVKENGHYQLTLSGHTHGLQWGIKLGGIPFSLAYLTRKNWGGVYQDGDNFLYVNTGLGTVGIPWRIDMPAEITVFTLKRAKIDRE